MSLFAAVWLFAMRVVGGVLCYICCVGAALFSGGVALVFYLFLFLVLEVS